MDRLLLNNPIRKLIVGDAKTGIAYVVGQIYGAFKITRIIRDENAYFLFGAVTYVVYAAKTISHENGQNKNYPEVAWKLFERQPIILEFDTNVPAPV